MDSKTSSSRTLRLWHCLCLIPAFLAAQPAGAGCETGGEYAAKAYIHLNPIYSYYFGSLEEYVAENREHFREGGDAIACLREMADAIADAGVQAFDPDDLQRQERINNRLALEGIGPRQEMSTATQLLLAADQMRRLVRGLPDAAEGDFSTLNTPTNEQEQQIIFAENLLRELLQSPEMHAVLEMQAPEIKRLANLEYRMHLQLAQQLGSRSARN